MVPEGWIPTELGLLARFTSGGTPSKKNDSYWGGNLPWISAKDLKTHFLIDSIDKLSSDGFQQAKIAPKGATLILVRGMTLLKDFPVGFATQKMAFNQDVKALIPKSDVDSLFLSYLLVGVKNNIRQLVSTAGHGTGRLDTESLKNFPVIEPPLTEQIKIAKILSTWDKAIETVEKRITNSQQQKKALMQQLLTGKKRFPGFDGEWEEIKLGDTAKKNRHSFTGGPFGSDLKSSDYTNSGVRIIQLQNIGEGDFKNKYKIYTSVEKANELISCNIYPGEIIISKMGDPVARAAIMPDFEGRYLMASDGIRLEIDTDKYCTVLIHEIINDKKFRKIALSKSTGSTRKRIGLTELRAIKIRIPVEIKEQQRIALVFSSVDCEIKTLQKKLEHFKQEKKALMQQLLTGKRRVKIDKPLPDIKTSEA